VTSVTLEALTKTFPRGGRGDPIRGAQGRQDAAVIKVVDSINLRIEEGEFFTLLGPSGCGKSTTLRMIAGFEEPTSGRILFDKVDVTHDPPNRRGVGFVFQNYALFPHLTVARNVAFGLEVRRVPAEQVRQRVDQALEEVQLAGFGEARVDQLSGGQQQRVALARALAPDPAILVADEPTGNLDEATGKQIVDLLFTKHAERGMTLVLVTHDSSLAHRCDRVIRLRSGRIDTQSAPA
jgi:putative ABC transport system ATP-binding protein